MLATSCSRAFDLVVAAVLVRLGVWLTLTRPSSPDESARLIRLIRCLAVLSAALGEVPPGGTGGWRFSCRWRPGLALCQFRLRSGRPVGRAEDVQNQKICAQRGHAFRLTFSRAESAI